MHLNVDYLTIHFEFILALESKHEVNLKFITLTIHFVIYLFIKNSLVISINYSLDSAVHILVYNHSDNLFLILLSVNLYDYMILITFNLQDRVGHNLLCVL